MWRKASRNNSRLRKKQVEGLKSLQFSEKQLLSVRDFISKNRLNPGIVDKLKIIGEEENKAGRKKMLYKGYDKTYGFTKRYIVLVMLSKIVLL